MRIAILGASGRVGQLLVEQSLERGHKVVALIRKPQQYADLTAGSVEVRQADTTDARTFPDLSDVDAIVSAMGIRKGEGPGPLSAGARILAEAGPRVVWLGALGTGTSTNAGGHLYQMIMKMVVGDELTERVDADQTVLRAGGTVFHAPDLWVGGVSPTRRTLPLAQVRRPVFPPHMSRASLAACMLDEAETGAHAGSIVVPVK